MSVSTGGHDAPRFALWFSEYRLATRNGSVGCLPEHSKHRCGIHGWLIHPGGSGLKLSLLSLTLLMRRISEAGRLLKITAWHPGKYIRRPEQPHFWQSWTLHQACQGTASVEAPRLSSARHKITLSPALASFSWAWAVLLPARISKLNSQISGLTSLWTGIANSSRIKGEGGPAAHRCFPLPSQLDFIFLPLQSETKMTKDIKKCNKVLKQQWVIEEKRKVESYIRSSMGPPCLSETERGMNLGITCGWMLILGFYVQRVRTHTEWRSQSAEEAGKVVASWILTSAPADL